MSNFDLPPIPDKLTDSEIVKALECCSTKGGKCTECPAYVRVDRSKCREVLTGALDLISRLQAENEKYRNAEERAKKKFKAANAKPTRNDVISLIGVTELYHTQIKELLDLKRANGRKIEELQNENKILLDEIRIEVDNRKKAQAEAVKEFAERLKEHSFEAIPNVEDLLAADLVCAVKVSTIDSLLKEVEES